MRGWPSTPIRAPATRTGAPILTLSGVVVEGFVHAIGDLGAVRVIHSTLVPGRTIADGAAPSTDPSLVIEATDGAGETINTHLALTVAASIAGPIACPETCRSVTVLDSIIDGLGGAALAGAAGGRCAPATIERYDAARHPRRPLARGERVDLHRHRRHRPSPGWLRPLLVRAPRLADPAPPSLPARPGDQAAPRRRARRRSRRLARPTRTRSGRSSPAWLVPAFAATEYGRPEYGQLRLTAPSEIRTGAADGAEMGVFCQLKQPQRESNLRTRLDEYLPFGLEAGLIYVT